MQKTNKPDLVDKIMFYESGELPFEGVLDLFSELVKDGSAYSLQGSYGRMANNLIENGYLDRKGNILEHTNNE